MLYYENKAKKSGFRFIAGVDEVGRGPLAGPVVAAAVILRTRKFKNLIRDSKKLSPLRREKAYSEIMDKASVGVGIVNERVIDKINIFQATRIAMENALFSLKVKPDFVLVDGNINLGIPYPYRNIIKGDNKSLSIAAASIIAKVMRDRIMLLYHRIYPEYGFLEHKGYGTKRHLKSIKRHGRSLIHRKSFTFHGE
jgi:ribonuclease HII